MDILTYVAIGLAAVALVTAMIALGKAGAAVKASAALSKRIEESKAPSTEPRPPLNTPQIRVKQTPPTPAPVAAMPAPAPAPTPPTPPTPPEPEVPAEEGINFNCPACGQNIDAPSDMAGEEIVCPACEKPLLIPGGAPAAPQAPAPAPAPDPAADMTEDARKGTTIRINLGEQAAPPEPARRVITVKRKQVHYIKR